MGRILTIGLFLLLGTQIAYGEVRACSRVFDRAQRPQWLQELIDLRASETARQAEKDQVGSKNPKVQPPAEHRLMGMVGQVVRVQLSPSEARYLRKNFPNSITALERTIDGENHLTATLVRLETIPTQLVLRIGGEDVWLSPYFVSELTARTSSTIPRLVEVMPGAKPVSVRSARPSSEPLVAESRRFTDALRLEISAFFRELEVASHLNFIRRVKSFFQKSSGNANYSLYETMRENKGERFYNLLRSGDIIQATTVIRSEVAPVAVAARVVDWASQMISRIQEHATSRDFTASERAEFDQWIGQLEVAIEKYCKPLSRYGTARTLAWQLGRYLEKVDQIKMVASREAHAEVNKGENIEAQLAEVFRDIEEKAFGRVEYIARRASGMRNFEDMFPTVFSSLRRPPEVVGDTLLDLVWGETNYHYRVFKGVMTNPAVSGRAYGSHLPLRYLLLREAAWESLAAIKNLIGFFTRRLAAFGRSINRNTMLAMINEGAHNEIAKKFNSLSMKSRKLVYWVIKELTDIEALERHAPRIDLLEDLLLRLQEKVETSCRLYHLRGPNQCFFWWPGFFLLALPEFLNTAGFFLKLCIFWKRKLRHCASATRVMKRRESLKPNCLSK